MRLGIPSMRAQVRRVPGPASGLAPAVRPAGSAEAPRARVGPEDAFCGAVCAERFEKIFGCPCGWRGRPGQCAAFRPARCEILMASGASTASALTWPWRWRARQRDTAGSADGRSPGPPCAAARRAVGLASEGRGESCRPRNGETPGEPWPLSPSQLLAPVLAAHGRGRQARRAEGAPLKL
jgi:hypothetical protein